MMTNSIFDQSIACAEEIIKRFHKFGTLTEMYTDEVKGVNDLVFTSTRYRRAHISIIDSRKSKNIWLLHVTIFPNLNDPSPIYGFDVIAGMNKVSGAFHDLSLSGIDNHPMELWFESRVKDITWNKPRALPDWAQVIFSKNIVAIGMVGTEELTEFISLGLDTLDYYLNNVGNITQDSATSYIALQTLYCRQQKKNIHTPKVLVNLGFTESEANDFVSKNLFPEIPKE